MSKTKIFSPGSIPNHRLLKNLQLDGNFLSNDGGNEGLSMDSSGIAFLSAATYAVSLDGSGDSVTCQDITQLNGASKFTISAWTYHSA